MNKTMKNMLLMAAAVLTATIMTACAGSDDTIADTPQQPENQSKTITLTTTVGLGADADDAGAGASGASAGTRGDASGAQSGDSESVMRGGATTRALTSGGVKTFAVGEKMALLYTNTSGQTVVVPSEALTDDDIVITGDAATDKKSATFTFRLTEAPNKSQRVKYIYPAAMATNSNVNYNRLYSQQDGTLTKLASDFDAASSEYLVWDDDNLPGATLTNRLAILAITLKNDATGADITSSITSLILSVVEGTYTYNVSRSAAAGPIYVAIRRTATEEHNSGSDINVTASDGTNIYTKTLKRKKYYTGNFYNVGWRMTPPPNAVPLTMEALTDGDIVVRDPKSGMKYSKNGGAKAAVTSDAIDVSKGDKVRFYGDGTSITCYEGTRIAGGTAEVKVYGNIMSLVDETDFADATTLTADNTFSDLFSNNDNLTDASGLLLPATTLAGGCYQSMFTGCTSLKTAPALPATTLAPCCYPYMFNCCTSLTTAPALPATTLASECYEGMFEYCTSLTRAPALPATTLAPSCYANMFNGCTNLRAVTCLATDISAIVCTDSWLYGVAASGTFTTPASTGWTDGIDGIPEGWTRVNAQ